MLEMIHNAYEIFNQLSVTAMIAIAVVFTIALLLAVREAAAWFFKVDDVKRDIRALYDLVLELEGEIRSLQTMLGRENILPSNEPVDHIQNHNEQKTEFKSQNPASTANSSLSFPINH